MVDTEFHGLFQREIAGLGPEAAQRVLYKNLGKTYGNIFVHQNRSRCSTIPTVVYNHDLIDTDPPYMNAMILSLKIIPKRISMRRCGGEMESVQLCFFGQSRRPSMVRPARSLKIYSDILLGSCDTLPAANMWCRKIVSLSWLPRLACAARVVVETFSAARSDHGKHPESTRSARTAVCHPQL